MPSYMANRIESADCDMTPTPTLLEGTQGVARARLQAREPLGDYGGPMVTMSWHALTCGADSLSS
jgi:hypothetical protein